MSESIHVSHNRLCHGSTLVSQREEDQSQPYGLEMMELTLRVTWIHMAVTWWHRYMAGTLVLIVWVCICMVDLFLSIVTDFL
jgi:hypothetical protein